jgi:dUTP pyrophosphatase
LQILIRRLDPELPLPAISHPGDAGLDLFAAAATELPPGGRASVPTGIAIALPEGYAGFVQPRSGRALHEGLGIVNAPGLVDSGYRGEILVILINLDTAKPIHIRRGDRIAQLVIQRVEPIEWLEVSALPSSERGQAGHGSSGP